jgi:hypothetical protein
MRFFFSLLAACLILVSGSAYSSTMKMEVKYSSMTSADFHVTTWLYILEDVTLHKFTLSPIIKLAALPARS